MSESWIDREVLALIAGNFATDLKILELTKQHSEKQIENEETIISLLTEIRDLLKGLQDGD